MSRITKIVCDGCGQEITGDPIEVFMKSVDRENGNWVEGCETWNPEMDFCYECHNRIKDFIIGLPKENEKKGKALRNAIANYVPEQKAAEPEPPGQPSTEKKRPMTPWIRELLSQNKTQDEILEITGCTKQQIYVARNLMKKAAEKAEPIAETSEPVTGTTESPDSAQAVKCSEVKKNCIYACKMGSHIVCDYAITEGHSRGCPAEECTKYRPLHGKRGTKKAAKVMVAE